MKINKSITFEKAMIDCSDWSISEFLKDETIEHDLRTVLKEFDQIPNITLTIKQVESGVEVEHKEDT